jgi:hypothetical protein
MKFKVGDRLKYIYDIDISYCFAAHGEMCTVTDILRTRVRVKFDHPKSIGHYRIPSYRFVGMCGFMAKHIKKHKMI